MSVILSATGLVADKNYSVQVRPIFNDGTPGDWGPSFAIIKRNITDPPVMNDITASPAGVRISWVGNLDTEFGEQWVVKKLDRLPTEQIFDDSGVEIYRGVASKSVDADLNQEATAFFAVAKMDQFGNRSAISYKTISFGVPDIPEGIVLSNSSGGFNASIPPQTPSNTNKYHVVRIKYTEPFVSYEITNMQKTGTTATLTSVGHGVLAGDTIQVSLNEPAFDGIFTVSSVTASTMTYTASVSGTVASIAAVGLVIPTDTGPSRDGIEVFRIEVESGATQEATYTPDISGEKVYIAVGTEDGYKNRASWQLLDASGRYLIYGRNYIAERDAITVSSLNNRTVDGVWRYGYAGFRNVHDTVTGNLNTAGTGGVLRVEPVSTDTPDTIMMGVSNGSTTAMQWATDPSSNPANCQTRIYPSVINEDSAVKNNGLSKPILSDSYFTKQGDDIKTLHQAWWDTYPTGTERATVWIECSASQLIDDTLNTNLPIELAGTQSLTGSFTVKPQGWGGVQDFPSAVLSLLAVTGEWDEINVGGVYDPHFYPLFDKNYSRAVRSVNTVVSRSSSSTTRTLVLASGEDSYPVAGDSITVSLGLTDYDGTWIVATASGSTITYVTQTAASGSGTVNGYVLTNTSTSFPITQKRRIVGARELVVGGTDPIPAVGQYIDVRIGDTVFDGAGFLVTINNGRTVTYEYTEVGGSTGSLINTPATARAVIREVSNDPFITEIASWSIAKNPDLGLFDENQTPQEALYFWNWTAPADKSIKRIRLVWALTFEKERFDFAREGDDTAWQPSTNYLLKLGNFEAWPGINTYAQTGLPNEFSEEQTFENGAFFYGDAFFYDDVYVAGDIIGDSDILLAGNINAGSMFSEGDIDINAGDLFVQGALGLNASNILFYTNDWPFDTANNPLGGNQERTINSIRASQPLTEFTDKGVNRYLYAASWSGSFNGADAANLYVFSLYRWTGSNWQRRRSVRHRGHANGVGGSIVDFGSVNLAPTDRPTFMVTVRTADATAANQGITTAVAYDALDDLPFPDNRLQLLILPYTRNNQSSQKARIVDLNDASGFQNYSPNMSEVDVADPDKNNKTAVIRINSGWKNTYTQGGAQRDGTGGDIIQGYHSSTYGNQRSAWGLGNSDWQHVSGDQVGLAVDVRNVKILSCKLTINPTHWKAGKGTLVVGTHNDARTSSINNFDSVAGKFADRTRIGFGDASKRTVDLGIAIGKSLWDAHARSNNDFGMTATADTQAGSDRGANGLLFGPAPNNSAQYYGTISPSSLELEMKVQWKE